MRPSAVVAGLVVVSLVAAALAALGASARDRDTADPFAGGIDPDGWQAVVLSTDRVYFGRLRPGGGDFYELRDAYVVRDTAAEGEEPERAVLPLTREVHGPEDRMLIRRDHVVVVEDLAEDSPVRRAIEDLERRG